MGKIKEIRYPCALGERAFTVKSVGGYFDKYILVVGNMEDFKRHFREYHPKEYEAIINFKTSEILVHDDYIY